MSVIHNIETQDFETSTVCVSAGFESRSNKPFQTLQQSTTMCLRQLPVIRLLFLFKQIKLYKNNFQYIIANFFYFKIESLGSALYTYQMAIFMLGHLLSVVIFVVALLLYVRHNKVVGD